MDTLHLENENIECPDGYEKKFLNNILKCKRCSNICLPPFKKVNEGSFCKLCCNNDRESLVEIQFSEFEKNEILSNIYVRCSNHKTGCTITYNYTEALIKYYDHFKSCTFTPVKCKICMQVFIASEFDEHKKICVQKFCERCKTMTNQNNEHDCITSISRYNYLIFSNLICLNKTVEELIKKIKNKNLIKKLKKKRTHNKMSESCINSNDSPYKKMLEGLKKSEENKFKEAESLLQEALLQIKNSKGEEDQDLILCYLYLASVYEDKCEYKNAMDNYNISENIGLKVHGEKSIELANIKKKKGNLYLLINDFEKAEKLLQETLSIYRYLKGEKSPEKASALNDLGLLYIELANYKKALECFKEAYDIFSIENQNNLECAEVNNNLGDLYYLMYEYSQSLDYYNKALKIRIYILGENHLSTALVYNNIGMVYVYYDADKEENANYYFNKALKIRLDLNKRYAAITYIDIGYNYYLGGNYEMALHNYNESMKIRTSIFSENHKDIALTYKHFALVYDKQNEYQKALEYMNKVKIIYTIIYGQDHVELANTYFEIGIIHSHTKNYSKSLEFYYKAINIRKKIFGDIYHPDTSDIYCYMGLLFGEQQEYEKAVENHKICLGIRVHILGDDQAEIVANAYRNLGITMILLEKHEEKNNKAEDCLFKTLKIRKRIYGDNHIEIANIFQDIGYYYEKVNDLDKGIEYYKNALKVSRKIGSNNISSIILTKLALIYLKKKDHVKAKKSLEKSLNNN